MAKDRKYVSLINYTKHTIQMVDIIDVDTVMDYRHKYMTVFFPEGPTETVGFYWHSDKNHRWMC